MARKHKWFDGEYRFRHFDRFGKEIWASGWVKNQLTDGGEEAMLRVFFRNETTYVGTFHMLLCGNTPTDTDTIPQLTEPQTNGYGRQYVERDTVGFPTAELDSGDWRVITKEVTFVASPAGSWDCTVIAACLVNTTGTEGRTYTFALLSQPRWVAAGESLKVTKRVKLQ